MQALQAIAYEMNEIVTKYKNLKNEETFLDTLLHC